MKFVRNVYLDHFKTTQKKRKWKPDWLISSQGHSYLVK